jgi:hypothetical protein
MSAPQSGGPVYTCPMHKDVRQSGPGRCPHCDATLQPEGRLSGLFRQLLANPLPLIVMVGIIIVLMIAAMTLH